MEILRFCEGFRFWEYLKKMQNFYLQRGALIFKVFDWGTISENIFYNCPQLGLVWRVVLIFQPRCQSSHQ